MHKRHLTGKFLSQGYFIIQQQQKIKTFRSSLLKRSYLIEHAKWCYFSYCCTYLAGSDFFRSEPRRLTAACMEYSKERLQQHISGGCQSHFWFSTMIILVVVWCSTCFASLNRLRKRNSGFNLTDTRQHFESEQEFNSRRPLQFLVGGLCGRPSVQNLIREMINKNACPLLIADSDI